MDFDDLIVGSQRFCHRPAVNSASAFARVNVRLIKKLADTSQ
jgi:hypothetical protein